MTRPPCGHDAPGKDGCHLCSLAETRGDYRKLWKLVTVPHETPCRHEGNIEKPCGSCTADRAEARHVRGCDLFGTCSRGEEVGAARVCGWCRKYEPDPTLLPKPTAGVVVGHYGMPRVAELQVRLVREHCGDATPILIHDDWSPEPARAELDAAMATLGVEVVRSGTRNIGHAGGDLGAIHAGLTWAAGRGLKVLVKLSQRFLIDTPGWLAEAVALLASGRESCLSDACLEYQSNGRYVQLPLRTEAIALDVARWARPEVMAELRPRRVYPNAAEHVIYRAHKKVGGGFRVWPLLGGPARNVCTPGVLWHCANTPDDYKAVAARYGIELGDDFFVHGWPKNRTEDWG